MAKAKSKKTPIKDVEFTPLSEFKKAAAQILSVSKKESDKQIEEYQAGLKKQRAAKKKGKEAT